MAHTQIERPDGTKITIEGSPEEIAKIMALYGAPGRREHETGDSKGIAKKRANNKEAEKPKIVKGPKAHLIDIKDEGFFSQKRSLSDIQKKLEEKGHIYPVEQLSTPVLRLVRQKTLRRLKDNRGWCYVNY